MSADLSLRSRRGGRGRLPLPIDDVRQHTVSVRLNRAELASLDCQRGGFQRGEWLRMAALHQLPPRIPAINRTAWLALATVVANINQYQSAINVGKAHGYPPQVLEGLLGEVQALRRQLLGVDEANVEDPDEGDAED